jgi:glucose 1-dehydrogenase
MKLKGKVALVTGGSQGIGQGIAIKLAEEGANVVISYRSHPEGAEETLAKIEALGKGGCFACGKDKGEGASTQSDVSHVEEVCKLVRNSIFRYGQLDILVNNAGLERHAPFWEVTEADYDLVLDTNLKGSFFAAQEFVKYLLANKRTGRIINISSVHEDLPFPNFAPYCLSKGGVKMMTRNLAVELGAYGITINNVAPGAIETPINTKLLNDPEKLNALLQNIPLNRLGQPNDVASLVTFLASDDASYITGTTFFVDGGLLWNYHEQ